MSSRDRSTQTRGLLGKAAMALDYSVNILAFIAGVLIVVIMLIVTVEILVRTITGNSVVWVVEITEFCLLWITFLGTAWVLKKEGHVRMDMILNLLAAKTQALLNIITSVAAAAICLIVGGAAVLAVLDKFEIGAATQGYLMWPAYLVISIIPVGCFLLCFQLLRRALSYYQELKD